VREQSDRYWHDGSAAHATRPLTNRVKSLADFSIARHGAKAEKIACQRAGIGQPHVLFLTARNINDIPVAAQLIERHGPIRKLLA
jgi:hypothetical protein